MERSIISIKPRLIAPGLFRAVVDCRVTSFVPNDGCLNFIDENDGMDPIH
jgi:hypothetical protein